MSLSINPETKVGALLEAYPELENVLISLAPAFQKLRNPVVRKTIAKVATLEQAAGIGGIALPDLIRALRSAAGQSGPEVAQSEGSQERGTRWLQDAPVVGEIDVDSMLATGVHPFGKVKELTARLQPGESIRLNSSFRPQPVIDAMRGKGFDVYSAETSPGRHLTCIGVSRE